MSKIIHKSNGVWHDSQNNDVWITPTINGKFRLHYRESYNHAQTNFAQIFDTEAMAIEHMVCFIFDRQMARVRK